MSNPTSNFGWQMPTPTDLVTDLPADFEVFGQAVDSTMADLKGGTSGQILSKNSNTDMDFVWITNDQGDITGVTAGTGISGGGTSGTVTITNSMATAITTAGDLIKGTGSGTFDRLGIGSTGQVLTVSAGAPAWATPSAGSSNVAGKNAILNSNFSVWQRGTSFALASSAITYTADRWSAYRTATGCTLSRQATGDTTNLPFIQYSQRVQRDSGNTSTAGISFYNVFESVNSIPFAGKTVTLSYYARVGANFSSTSNYIVLKTGTGTDQSLYSGFTGAVNAVLAGVTYSTTWTRYTYTATLNSNITQLAVGIELTPSGTAGAADWIETTGWQLEIAGSASAYSPNTSTQQAELAACMRYFERIAATSASGFLSGGYQQNSTQCMFTMPIVAKRVSPGVSFSGAGTPQIIYSGGSGVNATLGTTYSAAERSSFTFFAQAASAVLGTNQSAYLYANGGAVNLDFSAEL